jgi:hypothetical protein
VVLLPKTKWYKEVALTTGLLKGSVSGEYEDAIMSQYQHGIVLWWSECQPNIFIIGQSAGFVAR